MHALSTSLFVSALLIAPIVHADAELEKLIAGAHRADANSARDEFRRPLQTLQFLGLKPDMHVVEVSPGAGWWTEILAPYLKAKGRYTATLFDESLPNAPAYFARVNGQMRAKLASDAELYGDVQTVTYGNPATDTLGEPGSADVVLTFRNIHGWINGGTVDGHFKRFYEVLKPGGVLGIEQHRAAADADPVESAKKGYVPQAKVIELATSAGFVLEETSELNANPKDTRDHPDGVWSLPPTLAQGESDREKYLAIGESDRMLLRFRKPAAP